MSLGNFLQLLKETGMRCGEAIRLKWTDVDFGRKLVKITPEKGGNPRILPISETLLGMLNNLPRKDAKIFPVTLTSLKTNFFTTRKHIASKLNNKAYENKLPHPEALESNNGIPQDKRHNSRSTGTGPQRHKVDDALHILGKTAISNMQ